MGLISPTEPVALGELGRVHFIGIGGAGMSGIARIMLARGTAVSGSDSASSAALDGLAALGARVHTGHAAGQLGDADTLVVSSAIRESNPELAEARRRGLRVLHRAAALASLMSGRRVIAVTGTHGKTTTTSMITTVLLETGAGPAYAIGGVLAATGAGAADGAGEYFVAEADESDGSFLMYAPDVAVVTNVEADHLDNYGTEQAYRESFRAFLGKITPGGLLVTSADDPGTTELAGHARDLGLHVITYGTSAEAGYRVTNVTARGMETDFLVTTGPAATGLVTAGTGRVPGTATALRLGVPGQHNALNAAAAFAVAVELGIEPEQAGRALVSYRGAARRLEPKGEAGGVRVLDSYAHHPTEFGAALGLADEAVVLDVYAAREDPEPGVTGRLVADAVPGGAHYVADFADVPKAVAALAAPGDLVLTMGAGDITRMGPLVLAAIGGT